MTLLEIGESPGYYSARTAARIARISPQSFQAWLKAHLLHPSKITVGKRTENTYSYDDLLLIRLIVRLKEQGAKPKAIRSALETIEYMNEGDRHAWKKSEIMVNDGMVIAIFRDKPERNPIAASKGSQKMAVVFFPHLITDLENELVPRDRFKHIEVDPNVLGGSPVIKGTRLSTRAIVNVIESGEDPQSAYPKLTDEQIREAQEYEDFLKAA